MEEQLISYETAKLAHEKGFDWNCDNIYNENNETEKLNYYEGDGTGFTKNSNIQNKSDYFSNENAIYTAPTQSLLAKWLRSKPTPIVVTPLTDFVAWLVEVQHPDKDLITIDKNELGRWFNYYEEAFESGLLEGLKLI